MRKSLSLLLTAVCAAGALAAPAAAGGKAGGKKVSDSFPAQALPLPKNSTVGDPLGIEETGCNAGQEGVHKVTHSFEAPFTGVLRAYMEGFTGDWDLFLIDADDKEVAVSANDQATAMAAAEEEVSLPLKKGQTIGIRACNWLGEPQIEVHYDFVSVATPVAKRK